MLDRPCFHRIVAVLLLATMLSACASGSGALVFPDSNAGTVSMSLRHSLEVAEIADDDTQVVANYEQIRIILGGNAVFERGSAKLTGSAGDKLDKIAGVLQRFSNARVAIAGHTDSSGKTSFNKKLSVERASAVAKQLQMQAIDKTRLTIIGYGETRPVSSNETPEGRAQNRRIELIINQPADGQ